MPLEPAEADGGGGGATVYLWQQDKHDRNAKSLAYLLNSAFSLD